MNSNKIITKDAESDIWNGVMYLEVPIKTKKRLIDRLQQDKLPRGPTQKLITEFPLKK